MALAGEGAKLWAQECVTSVWLSVQCLQETNVCLSFFMTGKKKKKLLTMCNTPPRRYPGEDTGGWGLVAATYCILHRLASQLRQRQQAVSRLMNYSLKNAPGGKSNPSVSSNLRSGIHNRLNYPSAEV